LESIIDELFSGILRVFFFLRTGVYDVV